MAVTYNLNKNKVATQKYLNIGEIRENTIVMKDGSMRGVLMASSINFALKNEDEQNAIIASYVSFLNNISFPLQIVIQSRELNIDGYLNFLNERTRQQTNELLKAQTVEYANYIKELISLGKIMTKRFYVVVPYSVLSDKKKGFIQRAGDVFNPLTVIKMKDERFADMRKELARRVSTVISGLSAVGLNVIELDTQGLIELFYNTYNPVTSTHEQLTEVGDLRLGENNI